ncbi:MAG: hypothetical protein CW346_15555 [Bacillaceae bacterium]|nr:hypothetical protein [Bacillaceae bacterium]
MENIDRENEGKQAADGFSQKPLMEKRSGPAAGRSVNPILSKTAADENVCTEHSQEIFDRGNPGKKRLLALGPDVSETKGTFVKSG